MTPPGPFHEDVVDFLTLWSVENLDKAKVRVRIQNSIGLPESESAPQPDVAWVTAKRYRDDRPATEDVLLVIEVSDATLVTDQRAKAAIYAEAGISEYWIVNIPHRCVESHREPVGGTYQQITRHDTSASLSPLCYPDVKLSVRELFQS
jgi:Uma2 family endonuclease